MLHPPNASPYNPRGHDSTDTERNPKSTMAMLRKAYELRLHISLKYITANVMDTSNGQIVAQVSTIEHALKNAFDLGRTTKNPQTAIVVGEILSRRIKLEALSHPGLKHGIHANLCKQIQKKGVEDENANSRIVWSIINSLRDNRIRVTVIDPDCNEV